MNTEIHLMRKIRIAIMVSGHGRGSNMQALINGCQSGVINGKVVLVIGTRNDAPAIQRAKENSIETHVISPKKHPDDNSYGQTIIETLDSKEIDLVCLAGFMRYLPSCVVRKYAGKIMNIHPALLPFFGGKGMYGEHVHKAVLESGMRVSGCTVHFVDENYDSGPIILQTTVPVYPEDTPETLAARVLEKEHSSYVEAVRLYSLNMLKMKCGKVFITSDNCNVQES